MSPAKRRTKTAEEKKADRLAHPPTTTVDAWGHLRVVRSAGSKKCWHGRPVKNLDLTKLRRGAEVCAACTFEGPKVNTPPAPQIVAELEPEKDPLL